MSNHYQIVYQPPVEGYNLGGIEQESDGMYILLNNEQDVDWFASLSEALHTLAEVVRDDEDIERVSMDVEF